jgi:hypothetical protein
MSSRNLAVTSDQQKPECPILEFLEAVWLSRNFPISLMNGPMTNADKG